MRWLRYALGTAGLSLGLLASTTSAKSGLTGSGHDFVAGSGASTWNASGEMCLPCHIPHLSASANTGTGTSYKPGATYVAGVGVVDSKNQLLGAALWNHSLSGLDANAYTLFESWTTTTTVTNGVSTASGPNGAATAATPVTGAVDQNTKLCLGCHDGTVALNQFNTPHGESTTGAGITMGTVASWAVKGANNDLTATHPIGAAAVWTFPTDTTNFVDPSYRASAGIMPLRPMATGQLAVGCSSCHDPHNTAGNNAFLWVPNNVPGTTVDGRAVSGSVLCENCHIK